MTRDDGELDNFLLCRYRTITQIRTVLRWFCVITVRDFREQKRLIPGPTVIRRHFYSTSPSSATTNTLALETLSKSANTNRFSICPDFIFRVRNMYDASGEIKKRVVPRKKILHIIMLNLARIMHDFRTIIHDHAFIQSLA